MMTKDEGLKQASKYHMQNEFLKEYNDNIKRGDSEETAVFWALYEWDLLEVEKQ